jgi:predicted Zn-dependent peptidase
MTGDAPTTAVTKRTAANGIRIVCEHIPTVRSVAAGVWCGGGVVDEPPALNGISHLIEHMFFKGTARRTAADIAAEIDGVGGTLDAFTEKESVSFFAHVLYEHADLALDLLSDILLQSTFPAEEFAKEKNVVAEEIKLYEDSPDDKIHDLVTAVIRPGEAIGMPILGSFETLAQIDRGDALRFRQTAFTADRIVIGAAGYVDPDEFADMAEKYFADVPGPNEPPPPEAAEWPTPQPAQTKDTEQTHLCVAVPALPFGDPDRYVLALLTTILGGNASSRLFQKVREDRGLAYSVYAYGRGFRDGGLLVAYAGTSPATVVDTRNIILEQFADLATNKVSEAELKRTREFLKGTLMLSLESTAARMGRNVRHEVYLGRHVPLEETLAGVEAVTAEDILRLAGELFAKEPAIVAIGPNADEAVTV